MTTITNIRDTFVSQKQGDKSFVDTARLRLAASGASPSDERLAYMFWGKPTPQAATCQRCILHFYNTEQLSGSNTLSVQRLSKRPNFGKLVYNNKPTVTGPVYTSAAINSAAPNTDFAVDLTALMNTVFSGGSWYGIQISINGTTIKNFHSTESPDPDHRPWVELVWSDAPDTPTDCSPTGGQVVSVPKPVVTFDFTDTGGDTSMYSFFLKIGPTSDINAATWTSPEILTLDGATQYDLSTSTYPGMASGATAYWFVMVKDGSGLTSGWSVGNAMTYVPQGALAITAPAASPNNFVQDTSPPVGWTFTPSASGGAQTKYAVELYDTADLTTMLWTSGELTGTTTTVTLPAGSVADVTKTYRLVVKVWDGQTTRVKEGGRTTYVRASVDFTFQTSNTVAPVSSLAMATASPYPWAVLTWVRAAGAPDYYTILRDNVVVEDDIPGSSLVTTGTNFQYQDKTVPARVQHTWTVIAKVNSVSSAPNPTVTGTTKPNFAWMMELDGSNPIAIVKSGDGPEPAVDAAPASMQETLQPVGGGAPVLVTQYLRGFEGHVEGVLADGVVPGLSGRTMRDRFKKWKKNAGTPLILYMVDETLTVIPYNMSYRPRARSGGVVIYDITFDFFEDE